MFHLRTFHELLTKTPYSYSSKFQDNTVSIHDNTLRRNWGQITWTLLQVLELKKEIRDVFGYSAHWWRSLTASVVSIARRRNLKKEKGLALCVGLLRVPSAFNNTLGEFPVSGLEHSTDSKLIRWPSWVLHGGRTLPLRGVPRTRYPRRLMSYGLEKHGWHLAFTKACTLW